MANEMPRPRVCAVCLHNPCACPDVIDAEQLDETEEAGFVSGLLRGDFDAA